MNRHRGNTLFIVVCVLFIAFGLSIDTPEGKYVPSTQVYPVSRQIHYSFTLQNRTNGVIEKAEFWTYVPVKETSTQRCIDLDVSHPHEVISDDMGNQVLYFQFANLPPYANRIITIKAHLELSEEANMIPEQDLHPFLCAEQYCESDAPEILKIAKGLKAKTQIETVRKIYQWVADNIRYAGYLRDSRGARYALQTKRGDCTEFMYLFTALCRANGIPARGIGGYPLHDDSTIIQPNAYHNWAEFYIDGVWQIADPQRRVFMQNQSCYIAMRIIKESPQNPMGEFHRFRFSGDGLKVTMNL